MDKIDIERELNLIINLISDVVERLYEVERQIRKDYEDK